MDGNLLKTITNKNYHVDISNLPGKTILYEFAKKRSAYEKGWGNKSNKDKTLIKLLKSPASMAPGDSKCTMFVSFNPTELCDRLKLLLQEKQVGNHSNKINH